MLKKSLLTTLVLLLCFGVMHDAEARRRKHHAKRKRYSGPPPTHPVVLWARTLEQSNDPEQRKVAAFKLSQYSQTIYQEQVVTAIERCMKDPDTQIKVLCTKAMGRAGNQSQAASVRKVLLEQYKNDPTLRNTIVRAFITRGDNSPLVHDTFLDAAKKAKDQEEILVLIGYFEIYGNGSDRFVDAMSDIYKKHDEDVKVKRALVKAMGDRSQGQDTVVEILSQCSDSKDTPLALNCLAGLQLQAKKDSRAWSAVEKTIESTDPDVLMATLDVINALPESKNARIATRLLTIIEEMDDPELQEKAVLALGACGDQSEAIVKVLTKRLEDRDMEEAVRIASALMLGKQAAQYPDAPRQSLTRCAASGGTQSLRSACQLGNQELNVRAKSVVAKPTPSSTPKAEAQVVPSPSPAPKTAVQASPSPSSTPKASAENEPTRDEASESGSKESSDSDEVKAKD